MRTFLSVAGTIALVRSGPTDASPTIPFTLTSATRG
jgi:hypothetical protein